MKIQIAKEDDNNWLVGDNLNYSISFSDANLYDLTEWNPTGSTVSAGRSNYNNDYSISKTPPPVSKTMCHDPEAKTYPNYTEP